MNQDMLSEAEKQNSKRRMAKRRITAGICIILTMLGAWGSVFQFHGFELGTLDGIVQQVTRNISLEGTKNSNNQSAVEIDISSGDQNISSTRPFSLPPGRHNVADTPPSTGDPTSTNSSPSHGNHTFGKTTQEQSFSKGTMALEFVHIPKTGGTSIEAAYIAANLTGVWGFCKFQNSKESTKNSKGAVTCPEEKPWPIQQLKDELNQDDEYNKVVQSSVPWHLPAHRWEAATSTPSLDIYTPGVPRFCVVRHPYDRLVSEYYFVHVAFHNPKNPAVEISATHLNLWAQRMLHERRIFTSIPGKDPWSYYPEKWYGTHAGHWIRQYDFVYDNAGRQRVEHVLRFENLTSEFDELMSAYNLTSIRLPHLMTGDSAKGGADLARIKTNKTEGKKKEVTSKLTRQDLSERTKAMIHVVFDLDFDIFNYAKDNIRQNWTDSQLWRWQKEVDALPLSQ